MITPKGDYTDVKKEKSMEYSEAILYDGKLTSKDEIAIASFDDPIISKIRVLEEIQPISSKFKPNKEVLIKHANEINNFTSDHHTCSHYLFNLL